MMVAFIRSLPYFFKSAFHFSREINRRIKFKNSSEKYLEVYSEILRRCIFRPFPIQRGLGATILPLSPSLTSLIPPYKISPSSVPRKYSFLREPSGAIGRIDTRTGLWCPPVSPRGMMARKSGFQTRLR